MATLNFKNPNTGKWEEIGGGIDNDINYDVVVDTNPFTIESMQIVQYDHAPRNQWVIFTTKDSSNRTVYFNTQINTGIPSSSPI